MDQTTFEGMEKIGYYEILIWDTYLMNKWKCDAFDVVLDIGACVGWFSFFVHMRNAKAKIFAYEACKETFNYTSNKYKYMGNIKFINKALGNGSPLYFYNSGNIGCNLFFEKNKIDKELETYSIKSLSLNDMFKENNIDKNSRYFIKVDCEGGEKYLLNDKKSINIIKRSSGFTVELHFPSAKHPEKGHYKSFPAWKVYKNWVYDNFEETHEIIYHYSNKNVGRGVYVLTNKESLKWRAK